MKTQTFPLNLSNSFESEAEISFFLNFLIEDGDIEGFCDAMGVILKERGITAIANDTNLTRAGLYKAFSKTGNPKLETVAKVMQALGLRLQVVPIQELKPIG